MDFPFDLVPFWLHAGPDRWFSRDDDFDRMLRDRFGEAHLHAARREFDGWSASLDGALALVLLLDQIPRNIYRDSAHAYATDGLARLFAARAITVGFDANVDPALRVFFYLPFEHSETPADQERSIALVQAMGDANYLGYAIAHRDVIARFGRFPHRNAALGRTNTAEEQAWLDAGGGFG
jgi:uncharacterized protein (DUF924 family)